MNAGDFPILKKRVDGRQLIYFDNAATTQKPKAVIDAMVHFYENDYGTVHRALYTLAAEATNRYHDVRTKIQTFIGAGRAEEIIFTGGTTHGLNLIASSFGKAFLLEGDEILLTEVEHHANLVPWQSVAEERGATLRFCPLESDGTIRLDQLKAMLTPRTKLLSIAHVSNTLGTIHPIKEIAALAHENGAKIVVDGAQAVPHMSVDVSDLDVDFYVFSSHKLYGPTGVGVLYGRYDLLDQMPPLFTGGDMIETVTLTSSTYQKPPLKFEAGTPPIAEVIGLGAAIEYLQSLGIEKVHAYETELLRDAEKKLKNIPGLTIYGHAPEKSALATFNIEGIHPMDLGTLLDLRGIAVRTGHLCAQTAMARYGATHAVRASFAFYNTKEEIDIFVDALKEIRTQLIG